MKSHETHPKKGRHLKSALFILALPLLMGQDCLPSPEPATSAKPLALDCVSDGSQLFIPLELTVALDRYPVAGTGLNADTSVVARIPAAMFCAVADSGATQVDLASATLDVDFDGVKPPGSLLAIHTAVDLPIATLDTAAACAGAYGPEVTVDFGTVRTTPWSDGEWTMDFLLRSAAIQFSFANVVPAPPPLYLLGQCEPTDKSVPPNGTTDDPEDSPRVAADRDGDGIYEALAAAEDQVRFNVNGFCVGKPCNDANDCTIDSCDHSNIGWCTYQNRADGTACDFGGEPGVCAAGSCGAPNPGWGVASSLKTEIGSAFKTSVAMDAAGNAIAVWTQTGAESLWSSRYTPLAGWSLPELIERQPGAVEGRPQIVFDSSGDAILIWEQFDGNHTSIWVNRHRPGQGWGSAELLELDDAGDARLYRGAIAAGADGSLIAVWSQSEGQNPYSHQSDRWNAVASHYSQAGGWSPPVVLDWAEEGGGIFDGSAGQVQVGMDANGNAVALWEQHGLSEWASHVADHGYWSSQYTPGGGWTQATNIWQYQGAGFIGYAKDLVVDAAGNALAVWNGSECLSFCVSLGTFGIRYTAGTGWETAEPLVVDSGSVSTNAQLAMDQAGNALLIWLQRTTSNPTQYSLWSRRYAQGVWDTAEALPIGPDTSGMSAPSLAMNAGGDAIAVWGQGDNGPRDIWSSRYVAGIGWDAAVLAENNGAPGYTEEPQVAITDDGTATCVWVENSVPSWGIWGTRFIP